MEWLMIGAVLGGAAWRLAGWARANHIRLRWYVWLLAGLSVLMAALAVMDYNTLTTAMEPAAAGVVLWLYGGPALLLALIAVGVAWWQNRKPFGAPTEA